MGEDSAKAAIETVHEPIQGARPCETPLKLTAANPQAAWSPTSRREWRRVTEDAYRFTMEDS